MAGCSQFRYDFSDTACLPDRCRRALFVPVKVPSRCWLSQISIWGHAHRMAARNPSDAFTVEGITQEVLVSHLRAVKSEQLVQPSGQRFRLPTSTERPNAGGSNIRRALVRGRGVFERRTVTRRTLVPLVGISCHGCKVPPVNDRLNLGASTAMRAAVSAYSPAMSQLREGPYATTHRTTRMSPSRTARSRAASPLGTGT